jgi:Zn-dependent M28 family amino/carboxypeptidase
MNVKNKFYTDDLTGYNVIAEIPGTDPVLKDQIVMLGGHLDSWHISAGATDDAAGCIVMMEAVRVLQSVGVKPRRTIRIALWGAEEQGLVGSYGYVKKHFGNSLDMTLKPEQEKVSVYFNLDNGTGKIKGIYLQNNEMVRDIFHAWLQPFSSMGATGISGSNSGSTDHISFDAVGIPAFQFIQDPLDYEKRTLHTNMDDYDHLFMEDLKQSATIVAAFVYNAAMQDEMLPRKPLPKPGQFVFENGFIK